MNDTIAAISTALGVSAISIIRVSGKDAINIVNKLTKFKKLENKETHTITYDFIMENDEVVDEVLIMLMRKPKTYTTEEVVEINSHGGIATTNKILELLLSNGCRLAEPGEFTKRAFLNGRISLIPNIEIRTRSFLSIIGSSSWPDLKLSYSSLVMSL